MSHLLIVHIGPVQDFIATARRSRDLWFGSWLLSELSKAAAKSIVDQEDNLSSLIFPSTSLSTNLDPNSSFDVANKIVAVVEKDPPEIAEKIIEAIKQRLTEIKQRAFSKIHSSFDETMATLQIDDMLEIFWVAKSLDKDYHLVRQETEALMAARKATRNYSQIRWHENKQIPKSSLDGQRESVIHEKEFDRYDEDQLWRKYNISRGERLCGVGLLKRYGQRGTSEDKFFSTSHVASLPFLQLLEKTTNPLIKEQLNHYTHTLENLGVQKHELGNVPGTPHPVFGSYDGHILYEERLSDFLGKNQKGDLKEAKKALSEFYEECEKIPPINSKRPPTYYGLLLADGDRMGKVIDNQKTQQDHQNISKTLSSFASNVRKIVEGENNSSLVYAGGDDVLAFVPIHKILKCAEALSKDFKEKLQSFKDEKGLLPTLSVGIAIVHHLEPLSDALTLVRAAEKAAKSVKDKDALAITVSKRGGGDITVKGKWGVLDVRLRKWVDLYSNKQIPHGVGFELLNLALSLSNKGQNTSDFQVPDIVYQDAAMGILARKRAKDASQPIEKSLLEEFKNLLETSDSDKELKVSVKELAEELIVAKQIAEIENLSQGKTL